MRSPPTSPSMKKAPTLPVQTFEEAHPEKVKALIEAEEKRRERKAKKQAEGSGSAGPLFDAAPAEDASQGVEG